MWFSQQTGWFDWRLHRIEWHECRHMATFFLIDDINWWPTCWQFHKMPKHPVVAAQPGVKLWVPVDPGGLLTRHSIDACFYPTWTISWWLHIIYIMSTMLGQPYHHMQIIKKQRGNPIVIAFSKIITSHLRGNRYSVASQSKHHTGSVHPGGFHIRLWLVVMDENLTKRTGSGWPYHICLANQ